MFCWLKAFFLFGCYSYDKEKEKEILNGACGIGIHMNERKV